ncbi:MAG: hypothetical protein IFK94_12245 [Acidobacteria bacterium]|uniref:AlgX/AlgJ SGNH hydrolase-like domain-containing protein n=1 Tax=Candidatus Polarisedimenticola svalbardensis TaxID=2886004 RepID=A0A8J6Y625_9BACT|nr:hypothetical protein [Candidatus Polarisedimenticola svalbardensis]
MVNSRTKKILFPLAALTAGFLILFLILEIGFRFLPVNQGLASLPVDKDNPVLRFQPNRTATWSKGWNFSIVNEIHTNNYGFINDQDYDPAVDSPLLAVIGDSYVEAVMVPFAETVNGRLAARAGKVGRVYSFASSGSALSQYLVYAEFARDNFRPAGLVIVIVGNDFDESMLSPGSPAGYHYFQEDLQGGLELARLDLDYGLARRLLRRSDFLMYLVLNLKLTALPARLRQTGGDFAGNTRRIASPERVAASDSAVQAFLARLPVAAGLPAEKILLVLDGVRPDLYDPGVREVGAASYWGVMRRHLLERASTVGYPVLDMEPEFRSRYDGDGRRFEFDADAHWNGYAHELVSEGIAASQVWEQLFATPGKE